MEMASLTELIFPYNFTFLAGSASSMYSKTALLQRQKKTIRNVLQSRNQTSKTSAHIAVFFFLIVLLFYFPFPF